jgi:AcrR family transcriptional regulator
MSKKQLKALLMSKDEVIDQLEKVFRQYGYEGATLARLSEATGLGKASLYHYFPKGKEEMAATVLNHRQWFEEHILAPLRGDGIPSDRIRTMLKNVYELYNGGQKSCLLAVLLLGESKELFQTQIKFSLNIWIDTLAEVLVDGGLAPDLARQRAEDAILQIQGALVLSRGLGDTASFERVIKCLPEFLLPII